MVGLHRVSHVIFSLRKNTRLDDVWRYMLSSPLDITHDRRMSGVACPHVPWAGLMTSGVGCHHRLCTTYMVARDCVCYAIIAIGKHTLSDDVGCNMPSLPLDSIHYWTTSAWYVIIAVGQDIRLENVRRGMPSWPLSTKQYRTTSVVEGNHRP